MMRAPDAATEFPRPLSERERDWCRYLLPTDRPAYASLDAALSPLVVLGTGRWGDGDLVLGLSEQTIDLNAPMEPVAVYGEVHFAGGETLSISIHQPDDEDRIEVHFSGLSRDKYEELSEVRRWAFSHWSPGEPSPAGAGALREVALDDDGQFLLVLDATRRILWLYDRALGGVTLIPVTNFYNELMLMKGVRDPIVALEHRRLFDDGSASDAELRDAFARYNIAFRKIDAERIVNVRESSPRAGLLARIASALRGGTR